MMRFSSAFFVVLFAFVVPMTLASPPSAPIPPTTVPALADATAATTAAAAVEASLATLHSKDASPTTKTATAAAAGSFKSIVTLAWASGSSSCSKAAETVTITCGNGGAIFLYNSLGSPTCTKVGTSALKCTRSAYSTSSASAVNVICQNSKVVTASLPSKTFLNCQKSDGSHLFADQGLAMATTCVGGVTVKSKSCGGGSKLFYSSGTPVCLIAGPYCHSTSTNLCSIFVAGMSMSANNYC